jgi:hypothetical protein
MTAPRFDPSVRPRARPRVSVLTHRGSERSNHALLPTNADN